MKSVAVHPGRLRQEMVRRGWTSSDLAREAKISAPTVRAALDGRPIALASLGCIVSALARVPANRIIDTLVLADRDIGVE